MWLTGGGLGVAETDGKTRHLKCLGPALVLTIDLRERKMSDIHRLLGSQDGGIPDYTIRAVPLCIIPTVTTYFIFPKLQLDIAFYWCFTRSRLIGGIH
jgi:hypothetical protein